MLPAGKLTPASPANPEKLPNCEDNELSSVVGAKRLEEVYMFGKGQIGCQCASSKSVQCTGNIKKCESFRKLCRSFVTLVEAS